MVYTVAYRLLGEAGLAQDATGQTFAQAWQLAASLDPGHPVGRGWRRSPTASPPISTAAPAGHATAPARNKPSRDRSSRHIRPRTPTTCGWSAVPLTRCPIRTANSFAFGTMDG